MSTFNLTRFFSIFLLSVSIFLSSGIVVAQNFPDKPSHEKIANASTKPVNEEISVLVWANKAAVSAYSYNFLNYKQQLDIASQYFTPEGWKQFKAALVASKNLEAVVKKKLVVSAVAAGSPIITHQGMENGKYTWYVQMPLLVTWQSANAQTQSNLIINMGIIKTSDKKRDYALESFIATNAGASADST
jgi:intracellular multiplication protein IcmL